MIVAEGARNISFAVYTDQGGRAMACRRWSIAAGETPHWKGRRALHRAIVEDHIAYASWRDGGLTIVDERRDQAGADRASQLVASVRRRHP